MDRRLPAMFVGDALALDFLNSIATPVDAPVDWIADGEGLLGWLEQARLAPKNALEAMRAQALPGELDAVADQARRIREWFRGFVSARMGRPLSLDGLIEELAPLNRLLERDEAFSRIVPPQGTASGAPELQVVRAWRSPDALLLPIGEAMARFVCTEDFSNLKACGGASCTLLFADHTRSRARRWCSMAICGNRMKQAAHRERAKRSAGG